MFEDFGKNLSKRDFPRNEFEIFYDFVVLKSKSQGRQCWGSFLKKKN